MRRWTAHQRLIAAIQAAERKKTMKCTVDMISSGKNRVCDQYIGWFRENFPDGGDIRDVLRTALEKRQYNIFDLWLWKYFATENVPMQRQRDAAYKCAEPCGNRTSPGVCTMLAEVSRNPIPCNNSSLIAEAFRYCGKVEYIMQILDEYIFAA